MGPSPSKDMDRRARYRDASGAPTGGSGGGNGGKVGVEGTAHRGNQSCNLSGKEWSSRQGACSHSGSGSRERGRPVDARGYYIGGGGGGREQHDRTDTTTTDRRNDAGKTNGKYVSRRTTDNRRVTSSQGGRDLGGRKVETRTPRTGQTRSPLNAHDLWGVNGGRVENKGEGDGRKIVSNGILRSRPQRDSEGRTASDSTDDEFTSGDVLSDSSVSVCSACSCAECEDHRGGRMIVQGTRRRGDRRKKGEGGGGGGGTGRNTTSATLRQPPGGDSTRELWRSLEEALEGLHEYNRGPFPRGLSDERPPRSENKVTRSDDNRRSTRYNNRSGYRSEREEKENRCGEVRSGYRSEREDRSDRRHDATSGYRSEKEERRTKSGSGGNGAISGTKTIRSIGKNVTIREDPSHRNQSSDRRREVCHLRTFSSRESDEDAETEPCLLASTSAVPDVGYKRGGTLRSSRRSRGSFRRSSEKETCVHESVSPRISHDNYRHEDPCGHGVPATGQELDCSPSYECDHHQNHRASPCPYEHGNYDASHCRYVTSGERCDVAEYEDSLVPHVCRQPLELPLPPRDFPSDSRHQNDCDLPRHCPEVSHFPRRYTEDTSTSRQYHEDFHTPIEYTSPSYASRLYQKDSNTFTRDDDDEDQIIPTVRHKTPIDYSPFREIYFAENAETESARGGYHWGRGVRASVERLEQLGRRGERRQGSAGVV
ncbi:uncharacterized protein LOC143040016 [Oratosquilla oratoria]|uniref:uncharacterized protein LOC143040016 n=1 Tax=Oratosquilla oratoria TaxID=337810 RepID=UPI003F76F9EB